MKTLLCRMLSLVAMTTSVLVATEKNGHVRIANKARPEQPAQSIPMDQLGAVAQKQYSGNGIAITPTATGATLRASFQKLEGHASTEGLWLESTAEDGGKPERFRVLASKIGRRAGSVDTLVRRLPDSGTVEATSEVAIFSRPGLVEEYRVSMDGVRQDFVVLEPPSGAGQLSVTLEVAGAQVTAAPFGAKLTLKGSGREIAYSRLHVTDAQGRELAATQEVLSPERLAVRVVDEAAIYPVRIDPTFSDADWVSLGGVSGANQIVSAFAVNSINQQVYVGGLFTGIGRTVANKIAVWDGSTWLALGTGMNDDVYALALIGSDVYAGGAFTTAGGVTVNRIAKWNGSVWSALGSGMSSGVVSELAVSGSILYAGGSFISAGGVTVNRIAKWNGSAWSSLGTGMNSTVSALALIGSDVYAGGSFTTAGGITANRIAKWDGSSWSALGLGMNSSVNALAVMGSDLYAGGLFGLAGGATASRIAKWNGSEWSAVGSGVSSTVSALLVSGSDLYAGGYFITAGGVTVNGIAKWNGSSWSALGSGMNSLSAVSELAMIGDDLFAGGSFNTAGGVTANHIAKWNGNEWSAIDSGMEDEVRALAMSGNDLYVGGYFTNAGGVTANYVAKWNGSGWSALGTGMSGGVFALAVIGSDLYAGGEFGNAGGVPVNGIAKWDGSSWTSLGTGIRGGSANVYALAASGSDLFVGGAFTTAGGVKAWNIAKWNGSAWTALGLMSSDVYALAVSGSDLYAGGNFISMSGGLSVAHIAKWDGNVWSALGSGVSSNVRALAVSGNDLYAGGEFNVAGGLPANKIAKWNGSTWSALGTGMNSTVRSLAVNGGDLYVGGYFTTAGGLTANRIAKWNGNAWTPLGSGVSGTNDDNHIIGNPTSIEAIVSGGAGQIFLGGDFTIAGGRVSGYAVQANIGLIVPEITVESPMNTNILDGGSQSFGTVVVGANTSLTFTIKNIGTADLTGLTITKDGTDSVLFSVTANPVAPLAPGGSTTFTVKFAPTSVGTKTAALHIASNDSDESPFDITLTGMGASLPASLAIQGSASVAAGGTADYTCMATFAETTTTDVSGQVAWIVSGGPSGTRMNGATLMAGSGAASTVNLTASLVTSAGVISKTVAVAIGTGLAVNITAVTATYVSGTGSSLNYQIQGISTVTGGTGGITAVWKLDTTTLTGTTTTLNSPATATPGSHDVTVTVTDGMGATAFATMSVLLPKASQVNEKFTFIGTNVPHQGKLYAQDAASPLVLDPNRKTNGLVVIIHGMDNGVASTPGDDWMKIMADAIMVPLPGVETPNIMLYDWNQDANTKTLSSKKIVAAAHTVAATVLSPSRGFGSALLSMDEAVLGTAEQLLAMTGAGLARVIRMGGLTDRGDLHGQALADYLAGEILADRVDPTAPILLIGHSAGGFVASNCGRLLLTSVLLQQNNKKPTNLEVVTLDTPLLKRYQVQDIQANGGRFERNVSSVIGVASPELFRYSIPDLEKQFQIPNSGQSPAILIGYSSTMNVLQIGTVSGFDESPTFHSNADIPGSGYWDVVGRHVDAHDWYINTILSPNSFGEGFYYSPFPVGHAFPGVAPMAASGFAMFAEGAPPPPPSMSGFSTFGNVTEAAAGTYTLTEQGNAGIYQDVTIPMNASTVKFRAQFTQAGDGDFIEVSFGNHLSLAVIADGTILRAGPTEFEVPVVAYGGETGQFLIKLNGVGADNAIAVVDNISITTDDDADGDGLTFVQETSLGTDPRYYDTDADGISDWEEVNTTLTNPLLSDSDGDGMTDAQEIIAGTNGVDAASVFRTNGTTRSVNGNVTITWAAKAGKTYRVQRSDTPNFTNYTVVGDNISGVEPTTSFTDSSVPGWTARVFYRVEVE